MRRPAPTLDEVAREAGVSRSTASRAINGGHRVAPATQRAIEAAIQRLGFAPNQAARSLATRQSESIALVIPEPDEFALADPNLLAIMRGVSHALAPLESQLVLLLAHERQGPDRIAQFLRARRVDGAMVASFHRDDAIEATVRQLAPVVFVGRPFEPEGVTWVCTDNVTGARIATQALIERGRRRIAIVSGPLDMTVGEDRLTGWQEALGEGGFASDMVAESNFSVAGGEEAAVRLLARHPDIDGIFAGSDFIGLGVMRALEAAGRRVRDDVSVVGFDALGGVSGRGITLTSVTNPIEEMTSHATRLLLERLIKPDLAPEHLLLPTELVPGDTL